MLQALCEVLAMLEGQEERGGGPCLFLAAFRVGAPCAQDSPARLSFFVFLKQSSSSLPWGLCPCSPPSVQDAGSLISFHEWLLLIKGLSSMLPLGRGLSR